MLVISSSLNKLDHFYLLVISGLIMRSSNCSSELTLSSAPDSFDQIVRSLTILRTMTTTHELIAVTCISSIRVQVSFFLEILIGFRASIVHIDL